MNRWITVLQTGALPLGYVTTFITGILYHTFDGLSTVFLKILLMDFFDEIFRRKARQRRAGRGGARPI